MSTRAFRVTLNSVFVVLAILSIAGTALADTRLFVPQFRFSDSEDTQFLIANQNNRDVTVDLWAFTNDGELLGQFQLPVKANGTRALTLGEAFDLEGRTVTGWVGAVSTEDGIQLSYTRIGERTESFEAERWASRELSLALSESGKNVVSVSNPNAFATTVLVRAMDRSGRFVGVEELRVGPFGQIELPAAEMFRGEAAHLRFESNADIVANITSETTRSAGVRHPSPAASSEDFLALVINSREAIGAYQVTLSFDPRVVQFSTKDIEGGDAEGFDTKPLVVNIDNVSGQLTLGSFQVGAHPSGRSAVARLRVARYDGASTRFGIAIDEITDTAGRTVAGSEVSVGMVRVNR